ncbi:cadherin-like beta sandwich domain-containing protein [Clostridium botulinum]|uniref:cadherin-like beta sandwich domain-containing protein n=1 Tax=Clostridium botulinum TaxID=1491 RepID=UPI0022451F04|nr:cadherin-like beta sandwich domain-containing protein [Clostridium botulinum]UZP03104.1 cadherin-like beta sandwich domain-containing protein [Clostridium botulinum]UZP06462.1 cadherin-like beta sandwich domain-containing protein [Clostridium botulinum]UZP09843.1 cadherin-like beta sandwich domain-containing protein [Clostridium botulinum]
MSLKKFFRNIIMSFLFIGIFAILEPSKYLNLINKKVYAASKVYLDNIYLSDKCDIDFSRKKYSYILDVDKSLEEIVVRARPEDYNDTVKINGEITTRDDKYRKLVPLEIGKNKIEIEVKDNNSATTAMYTLYIYRGGNECNYLLDDINIDSSNIGFKKDKNSYNIEIDDDTSKVLLNPIVKDKNYKVIVNGTELDYPNLIRIRFSGIGKYEIRIKVIDPETNRFNEYDLDMYVGIPISPDVSNSVNSVVKPNQWVIVNGRWRYNDSLGEPVKDKWFFDTKYNNYFYFNKRGNMRTGWLSIDGEWYYASINGERQTGWLLEDNEWYYFDYDGIMKTGWIQYKDKWYFLDSIGAMQTGWICDKGNWYILNNNGEMINGWITYNNNRYFLKDNGQMAVGWFSNENEWYYFNANGSMKSGEWLFYRNNWYYINYIGTMRTGWLYKDDKYYYLNEDGTMNTATKTIDGYTYNFNRDGSVNFN